MLQAGGVAIFDKPIPLADFLDAVERSLGLVRTIFPPESSKETEAHRQTLSELLGGFRQKIKADAVFLISDRGRVLARAGDLYDSSMEVSLLSSLDGDLQRRPESVTFHPPGYTWITYHVFRGGDHDLILIPVNTSHACCWPARSLPVPERMMQTVEGMLFVRGDVENVLQSLGVAPAALVTEADHPGEPEEPTGVSASASLSRKWMSMRCSRTAGKKSKVKDVDAFWDEAVEKTRNIPTNPDVITFEEARKLGLDPGKASAIKSTGPLKGLTGLLKKK